MADQIRYVVERGESEVLLRLRNDSWSPRSWRAELRDPASGRLLQVVTQAALEPGEERSVHSGLSGPFLIVAARADAVDLATP